MDFVSWDYYSQYMKNMSSSVGVVPIIPYLFPIYGKNVPSHQPDDDHPINQCKPWGLGASMGILHKGTLLMTVAAWWNVPGFNMNRNLEIAATYVQHMNDCAILCSQKIHSSKIVAYVFWFTRSTRNDVSPGNAMFFLWCSATLQKGRFFSAEPAEGPRWACPNLVEHALSKGKQSYLKVHVFERAFNISGWWFEPLWKILVNWDHYSQYMEK